MKFYLLLDQRAMLIENGPNGNSYTSKTTEIKKPKSSLLDNRFSSINEFSKEKPFNTNTNEGLRGNRQKSREKNMNHQKTFNYQKQR